jgi:hypothetical protein
MISSLLKGNARHVCRKVIMNPCVVALDGNGNLIVAECGNHSSPVIISVRNNAVSIPIKRHYAPYNVIEG